VSWSVPTDTQPALAPQVIDPVGDRLANLGVGEVVHPDPLGLASRLPLSTPVGAPTDQLLLLGIHTDYRLAGGQVGLGLLVHIAKLRVPVRMLGALQRLLGALQRVALVLQ